MSNILIQNRYYKVLPFIKSLKLSIKLKNSCSLIYFIGSWGLSLLYLEKIFFVYKHKIFFNSSTFQKSGVTFFSLLKNIYSGLQTLHQTTLLITGLGFKVSSLQNLLVLKLGFSHLIIIRVPKFIYVKIFSKFTNLYLASSNLCLVKTFCSRLRYLKLPNVYKGKGIKYINEYIRLKVVKKL
jgi:large subunit ribosomal protein L6